MVEVYVPATSANLGAGFDSMGIALDLYNRIRVETRASGLRIINRNSKAYLPINENNLIYQSVKRVFEETGTPLPGLRIVQNSKIPVTRGLGSSSACIVGGLIAGNLLSGEKLSREELFQFAAEMEGHPDNVAPAFFGGFCIAGKEEGKFFCKSMKITPKYRYALMVPDYFVATKKARQVLPETVNLEDAAFNVSRAALFTAGLLEGDSRLLRLGAEDRLHQPYRKKAVEGMQEIFEESYRSGALATFLSGSGPTILAVLEENFSGFQKKMQAYFAENFPQWSCRIVQINNVGAVAKLPFYRGKGSLA